MNGCGFTRAKHRQKKGDAPVLTESTTSVSQTRHTPVRAAADNRRRLPLVETSDSEGNDPGFLLGCRRAREAGPTADPGLHPLHLSYFPRAKVVNPSRYLTIEQNQS